MEPDRKIALVTGAARGIGRGIAVELAREGADVIVNYTSRPDAAEEVVKEIKALGRHSLAIKADVANEDDVKAMIDRSVVEFGDINILVNNAGVHRGGRVQLVAPDDYDLVLRVALRGAFNCCRHIVPMMVERLWGRVINISSNAGLHGHPGDTAYGAAKAGLIGFTKSLAKETAKKGITANVVVPGYFQTDMTAGLFDTEEKIQVALRGIPMGRPGRPEEVGAAVSFLAFKGSYTTGEIIRVDGGMGM